MNFFSRSLPSRSPFGRQFNFVHRPRPFSISAALKASKEKANRTRAENAKHPLMKPFFGAFKKFTRNPQNSPEKDFRLLEKNQNWVKAGIEYQTVRQQFLKQLIKETNSPVHKYFITKHPDFIEYDSEASPRSELERLRIFKKWKEKNAAYKTSKEEFQKAFEKEFKSALDRFFSDFRTFSYNPRNSPMAEFRRLMAHKKWKSKKDPGYKDARNKFFKAFREDFNAHFGTSDGDIKTWQHLCQVLGVKPIPKTVQNCRGVLGNFYVNIHDLLYHKRTGAPFDFFPNLDELRKYTNEEELYFPKSMAKAGPLRFLLREILVARKRVRSPSAKTNVHIPGILARYSRLFGLPEGRKS